MKTNPITHDNPTPLNSASLTVTEDSLPNLDFSSFFEVTPPPLDFVLPGFLSGTLGSLVSPGGAGKSMLALQLGIQIASGDDTLEWKEPLEKGLVAYLPAEDPIPAIHHRIHALGNRLDPSARARVVKNFSVHPLIGQGVDVRQPNWQELITKAADGRRLVILDTFRRFHSGNENDSGEMAAVLCCLECIAEKTGATILFLHHSSKSAALNGVLGEQQSSRGSSVLTDNVRWQGFLSGMTEKEAKELGVKEHLRSFYVRFGVAKQNYGAPFTEVWFERQSGGLLKKAKIENSVSTKGKGKIITKGDAF